MLPDDYGDGPSTAAPCAIAVHGKHGAQFQRAHEAFDHPKSEFTQFAELLSQPQQDPVNPAHDAIDPAHHAATLSAQQAHHFLV
jgi:hypothetical protein